MISYGWFSAADQDEPEHDPGINGVSCPLCESPLQVAPRRTISFLVLAHPDRSYFFRVHRHCSDDNPRLEDQLESELVDMISRGVN